MHYLFIVTKYGKGSIFLAHHVLYFLLLASERSERDTYRGNTIENRGCQFVYLYICMDVRKAFLYFDPRVLC